MRPAAPHEELALKRDAVITLELTPSRLQGVGVLTNEGAGWGLGTGLGVSTV